MKYFKLINVEQYMSNGYKMPPQIHSVPAIMFSETKTVIFGKQVFDYLLLPKKGFLLNLSSSKSGDASGSGSAPIVNTNIKEEPLSFSLNAGDSFAFIDDTNEIIQKPQNWCGIDEQVTIPTPEDTVVGENSKKKMPDIATLRSQRELDIQQCTASAAPVNLI